MSIRAAVPSTHTYCGTRRKRTVFRNRTAGGPGDRTDPAAVFATAASKSFRRRTWGCDSRRRSSDNRRPRPPLAPLPTAPAHRPCRFRLRQTSGKAIPAASTSFESQSVLRTLGKALLGRNPTCHGRSPLLAEQPLANRIDGEPFHQPLDLLLHGTQRLRRMLPALPERR